MRVLACFLSHPHTAFYKRELARKLDMSPSAVVRALESFESDGILRKEVRGREHFFTLNIENCIVPPLKKAYGLALILSVRPEKAFLAADSGIISLALYGSYARGDFDERSDIDFLVLTHGDRSKLMSALRSIEDDLGIEANLTVFRLSDWKSMADSEDAFYKNVERDYIILHGSDIKWRYQNASGEGF
ncbi:MAG: Nucleotidyltransferase domain protein [Methanocella sp. PtaU1.Bin125]|nr:MAG: Nucleotidyltransferase domain protein [Methanocella sp. PtaU1.Bin125]